jgi:hypothetical protein
MHMTARTAVERDVLARSDEVENFLWGLWNGISAWPVLIVHVFGVWDGYPVYNLGRDTGWYQFGFLLGAGSLFLGLFGRGRRWREH